MGGIDDAQPAHGKAQGKADRCPPGAGKRTGCTGLGLHLVQGSSIETGSETAVERLGTQRPCPGTAIGRIDIRKWRSEKVMAALERMDARAQFVEHA